MDNGTEQRHRSVIESYRSGNVAMGSKNHKLFEDLTVEEQDSLDKLCSCGCDAHIPDEHAARLLDLGLVEVSCGSVSPTRTGKHVWSSRTH